MTETTAPSGRVAEIVAAASHLLETEGPDALTMRRLGAAIGIRAPSLYKHFPDKAAVEIALMNNGFIALAEISEQIVRDHGKSLAALADAYRAFALDRPHLYRLMTEGELPRERLQPGVEERAGAPLGYVLGDENLARAAWAFAHGMIILELDNRFPPDADITAAWTTGLAAFEHARQHPTAG